MSIRHQRVTPFNDSEGPSTEHEQKSGMYKPDPKHVRVLSNASKMRMSGIEDPLHAALGHRGPPVLPSDTHTWSHSGISRARGAHYNPSGEFGVRHRTGAGRGVYSYGGNRHSAVPGNAVGSPSNRVGGNAVGNPPHRRGSNAIGNPPNRYGENALASRFVPRGGGGHKP